MKIRAAIAGALKSSRVTISAAAIAIMSLPFVGAHDAMDLWAATHLDGLAPVVRAFVDGAAAVGLVVIWPAIIAATLGRSPLRSDTSDRPRS